MKILGQKNETTTKSNYQNASLAAKLNYLEAEMDNLKTKVEISGGVPKCTEVGTFSQSESEYAAKTFTGPGVLYVTGYSDVQPYFIVDGVDCGINTPYCVSSGNSDQAPFTWCTYQVPFHDQCSIHYENPWGTANVCYAYYKY